MNTHVKLLGLFYLIWGAMGLVATLAIILIFGLTGIAASFEDPKAGVVLGIIGSVVVVIAIVTSLPDLLAGWGLVRLRSWSRVLTIILSILHLFAFPLGTALGVYGLWVLFQPEVIQVLEHGQSAAMNRQMGRD